MRDPLQVLRDHEVEMLHARAQLVGDRVAILSRPELDPVCTDEPLTVRFERWRADPEIRRLVDAWGDVADRLAAYDEFPPTDWWRSR